MLVGLVGKPNAGKSTFFKALTLAEVAIAPYPFTTLEKNEGIGFVKTLCPETEFGVKCKPKHGYCLNGKRFVPIKIIDVAGLVPGAHLGKGRGNQFLDNLREADVLIHILDTSGKTDAEGKPTLQYDICYDIRFLQEEIDMWMLSIMTENWQAFARKVDAQKEKNLGSEITRKLSGLKIKEEHVKKAILQLNLKEKASEWKNEDILNFVRLLRKISKPIIVAANKFDLPESEENFEKLKKEFPDMLIVPCSAEYELALREAARDKLIEYIPGSSSFEILQEKNLNEKQKKALSFISSYLEKNKTTGVQQCLNSAVFDFLNYIVAYPVENETHFCDSSGNILPDAFLMPPRSTTSDLAYAIHTEIGRNFVAAIDARTKKRLSRDYILKNGDVIKIMTKY